MKQNRIAILHYSAPPVVGGVEAVILAHAQVFLDAGYSLAVIAGQGNANALPTGTEFILIPEIDSQHPAIVKASAALELGEVPSDFNDLVDQLLDKLVPVLNSFDTVIVHNVHTKHFNLPLTAALVRMQDSGVIRQCIAWCHDFSWTSPNSRSKVHPGYPWDLLRIHREDTTYVTVSEKRQRELAELFGCPRQEIEVVYNGVDINTLLGLSTEGRALIDRLGVLDADLVLLMPVRVTQAKNIEYGMRVIAALKNSGCKPKLILTGPPDPHSAQNMEYYQSLLDLRRELGVEQEMRFVYESGLDPSQPYTIDARVVGDLFRVSDMMFLPSHREGFGMPVLEAGLAGLPVLTADVPAAREIGGEDVIRMDTNEDPARVADHIMVWIEARPIQRLRARVRKTYTWPVIFRRDIEPLLALKPERKPAASPPEDEIQELGQDPFALETSDG